MKFSSYTTKNVEEVLKELKTSEEGLSEREAANRLKIYGLNEIKAKETSLFDIFLRQFKSSFVYLLFIAALVAFSIGEIINGFLILFFVFINVFLGFFQEARAQKAILLLRKYLPSNIRVLRGGEEKVIDKKFLVPGDIILLKTGDIIPVDSRVLKVQNFLVDESILSGESVPIPKISQSLLKETKEIFEAKNILFAGTAVISGEAEGLVIGTGKDTAFGQISKLVSEEIRESIYEKNLLKFSQIILRIVVITIISIFLANLFIKGGANFFDYLIFSIALIVSVIPEALPLVVTFTFSQGALRMAKEKVVVRRLSAIEDLGDIEILCTDKTGTLTENKLRLENIYSANKDKCLLYGLLSSSYMKEEIESVLNPFDSALFEKASQEILQSLKKFKVISEIPFDPFRLRNSTLLEDENGGSILIVKGAPETILELSAEIEGILGREKLKEEIKKEGKMGKRTLALAFKKFDGKDFSEKDEKDLTFLGYFSFSDPLKKTAKEAISAAKKLGVEIKILTGDSKEVASYVAKEIGLIKDPQKVILGGKLDSLSEEDLEKVCDEFSVFARISPQTKYKIVKTLQKKYEVGFLGEGINDVPALKVANVAIAVKEAADVSREVSDIILLKKDLKVLINGILRGRNTFSNINKYIKCTLSSNFGNFYSIALISLFIPFLPMLPSQILLMNLLSDFPLIAVVSDKVDAEELKKPKLYQLNNFIFLIFLLALTSTIFDFIFFGIFHKAQPSMLQTLWFIESILTEIVLIFSIRTFRFFGKAKLPSLPLMIISFLTFLITVLLPFTNFGKEIFYFISPSLPSLSIVLILIIGYFITSEIVKLVYFQYWHKMGST